MKRMKKVFAFLLTMVMVLAMAVPAMADGSDGAITLTNAAIGEVYKAYKILDATYDGEAIAYTTNETMKAIIGKEGSPFKVSEQKDASENYNVTSTAKSETINNWIKENLTSFTAILPTSGADNTAVATSATVKWTGLAYGYYYITSGLGSEVTVNSAKPSVTVIDKNDTNPSGGDDVKKANQTTAQIGDPVNFTVEFNATNFVTKSGVTTKIEKYDVVDTPNGYDIDVDSVQVVAGNEDITSKITNKTIDTTTGALKFTIPWVDANKDPIYTNGIKVTITYSGAVNADAFAGQATNNVEITNNATTDKITGTSTVADYNLTINKVDGSDNALKGAKFELYRGEEPTALALVALTDAELTAAQITKAENTVYYRVVKAGESSTTTTIDMSNASSAVIYGLDGADTYQIKETEAPKGYNKLEENVPHKMDNKNGTETITNNAGSTLPSTGGIGTTLFYVIGAICVLGAGVLLVTRRRMASK